MVPVLSLALLLGACQGDEVNEENTAEPTAQASTEKNDQTPNWKKELKRIIKENPDDTESKDRWYGLMSPVNVATEFNDKETKKYEDYLIKEFENGNYLKKLDDNEYMLTNAFLSEELSRPYSLANNEDNQHYQFLSLFAFNTNNVWRGFESIDSEEVKANEEAMKKYVQELK